VQTILVEILYQLVKPAHVAVAMQIASTSSTLLATTKPVGSSPRWFLASNRSAAGPAQGNRGSLGANDSFRTVSVIQSLDDGIAS
jgi:hypothetical protein